MIIYLPIDILNLIAIELDIKTLCNYFSLNKFFKSLDKPLFWRNKLYRDFPNAKQPSDCVKSYYLYKYLEHFTLKINDYSISNINKDPEIIKVNQEIERLKSILDKKYEEYNNKLNNIIAQQKLITIAAFINSFNPILIRINDDNFYYCVYKKPTNVFLNYINKHIIKKNIHIKISNGLLIKINEILIVFYLNNKNEIRTSYCMNNMSQCPELLYHFAKYKKIEINAIAKLYGLNNLDISSYPMWSKYKDFGDELIAEN